VLTSGSRSHDAQSHPAAQTVSLLACGQRAAFIISLIQSVKLNGHDPHLYLKDVLERLPTQSDSRFEELLAHRWRCRRAGW